MTWREVPLGSVVTFLDHLRRPITEKDRVPGPVPYFGANGQQDSVTGFIFDEPLVLLAEDGGHFDEREKGVAYPICGPSWVNNHAHVLRPKPELNIAYLARVLENRNLLPFISGSTRGKLTKSSAERIPIPLPPLPEQRRIAEILDRADVLRAKRRQTLTLLDEAVDALIEQLLRAGRHENIPLEALANTQGGLTVNRARESLERRVEYLRVANTSRGALDLTEVKEIGVAEPELRRVALEPGDVLIVEGHGNRHEVGRAARWTQADRVMTHQNHLIRVRAKPGLLSPIFLEAFLNSRRGRSYFESVAKTTSGLNTINMSNVKQIPIPVFDLTMQEEFARQVNAIRSLSLLSSGYLETADELFASLQQAAFSGQL